jgi:hypothetical protein
MPGAYIAESENVNLAQDTRPGTRWDGYNIITDGVKSTDRIDYFDVGVRVNYDDVGIKQRHGGYVKAGGNWKIGTVNDAGGFYGAGIGTWHHKKLTIDMLPFHNNEILDSSNPEFKLQDVRRGTNAKATAFLSRLYHGLFPFLFKNGFTNSILSGLTLQYPCPIFCKSSSVYGSFHSAVAFALVPLLTSCNLNSGFEESSISLL